MRSLNLDQLKTLRAVVSLGGFSAAARQLNLTQPAISLQVRELEQRLGVTLVERLGRRARATPAGQDLLEHTQRLLVEEARTLETLARHRDGGLGRIRFGVGAATLTYLLPPALARVRQEQPGLELVVSTGPTERIVELLRRNEIDLALLTLPAEASDLAIRPLRSDPMLAVFSNAEAALPAGLPPRITLAELLRRPFMVESLDGSLVRLIRSWFAAGGVALHPAMVLGSLEAVAAMVAAGLGSAILPAEMLRHRTDLVARPLDPPLSRSLALAQRLDKVPDRGFKALQRALLEVLRSGPAATPD